MRLLRNEITEDRSAAAHAREIAYKTLAGDLDPLIACRWLADLRLDLPGVPEDVMDVFVGVDSEVDGLPIGLERVHWAEEALRKADAKVEDYRQRIKPVIVEALWALLRTLPATSL